MISIHLERVKQVQNIFLTQIEKHRKDALKKLESVRDSRFKFDAQELAYLNSVIDLFSKENILTSTPKEIKRFKGNIGKLPPNSCPARKKYPLKKIILDKLNYTYLRNSFYPQYFNQLKIKACVYCNSALTISVEKTMGSYSARFDVDHYEPKDEYPFLSIFLFNLYPACAPCNRRKSKSTLIKFNLYSDNLTEIKSSNYKFKLGSESKSKFLLTKNVNDLKFTFEPNLNILQTELRIEEIYSTQKDLIEELIVKQNMYDHFNRKSLQSSFSKLNLHPDLYLRSIVGNYTKESEIHKRPMAKFMQDIARDLGIID